MLANRTSEQTIFHRHCQCHREYPNYIITVVFKVQPSIYVCARGIWFFVFLWFCRSSESFTTIFCCHQIDNHLLANTCVVVFQYVRPSKSIIIWWNSKFCCRENIEKKHATDVCTLNINILHTVIPAFFNIRKFHWFRLHLLYWTVEWRNATQSKYTLTNIVHQVYSMT